MILTVSLTSEEIIAAIKAWVKLNGYVLKQGAKVHCYTSSVDGCLRAVVDVEPPGQPKMLAEGPYR